MKFLEWGGLLEKTLLVGTFLEVKSLEGKLGGEVVCVEVISG